MSNSCLEASLFRRWLAASCVVLLLGLVTSRAVAEPCGPSHGIAQVEIHGFSATARLNDGTMATAVAANGASVDSEEGELVLTAAQSLEWKVTTNGEAKACSIAFAGLFPKDRSPLAVGGFTTEPLPSAMLVAAAPNFVNPKFTVRHPDAQGKRYGNCGTPLESDNRIPSPFGDTVQELELALVLGDRCVTVLHLRRDTRKVVIQQGHLVQEALAASPPSQPLVIFHDSEEAATCSFETPSGSARLTCNGVLDVPADGPLAATSIPVHFVSLRAVSTSVPACPREMPALDSALVVASTPSPRAVKLCAYRYRHDGRHEVLSPDDALPTMLGLRMQSCSNGECADETPLTNRLTLLPQALVVSLHLSAMKEAQRQTVLVLKLGEVKDAVHPVPKPGPTLYVKASDMAETLRRATCLGSG